MFHERSTQIIQISICHPKADIYVSSLFRLLKLSFPSHWLSLFSQLKQKIGKNKYYLAALTTIPRLSMISLSFVFEHRQMKQFEYMFQKRSS